MINLSDIASVLNGADDFPKVKLTGVSIDSRSIEPGNVFIAVRGANFDGHRFILDAIAAGASAIICDNLLVNCSVPQLVVSDTLSALTKIATWYRQTLNVPLVALTGSNGKTTVKEMIAAILPQPSFATVGNLNNHIGVPLNLLRLTPEHRYGVFELGASQLGDIAYTVSMVKPTVALVNNIAPAHVEGFGSIENVAITKGAIYEGLLPQGIAIVNDDDAFCNYWDALFTDKTVVRFSIKHATDMYADMIRFNAEGCASFRMMTPAGVADVALLVPGLHQVSNALAAASCTLALGIDLEQVVAGLANFKGVAMRMTHRRGKKDALIIDDSYNANLNSVLTALNVLANKSGRKIFVFGDMGELGQFSQNHHEEVGKAARDLGVDILLTFGDESQATARSFGENATHYHSQQELIDDLLPYLDATTSVLVKGSRSSAMDKIVSQLIL